MPGGLTPRRTSVAHLAQIETEVLDVLSPWSPLVVIDEPRTIDDVHKKGLVHKGAWLFILDRSMQLLLAWRGPHMATCPNSWSCPGEHSLVRESFQDTGYRGLSEEVPFLGKLKLLPIGEPFLLTHSFNDTGKRIDHQWTQNFLAFLPEDSPLNFSNDALANLNLTQYYDAAESTKQPESTRFSGMPLLDVMTEVLSNETAFCGGGIRMAMARSLALVARAAAEYEPALFGDQLGESWTDVISDGFPVCCTPESARRQVTLVKLLECGVACQPQPVQDGTEEEDV